MVALAAGLITYGGEAWATRGCCSAHSPPHHIVSGVRASLKKATQQNTLGQALRLTSNSWGPRVGP